MSVIATNRRFPWTAAWHRAWISWGTSHLLICTTELSEHVGSEASSPGDKNIRVKEGQLLLQRLPPPMFVISFSGEHGLVKLHDTKRSMHELYQNHEYEPKCALARMNLFVYVAYCDDLGINGETIISRYFSRGNSKPEICNFWLHKKPKTNLNRYHASTAAVS